MYLQLMFSICVTISLEYMIYNDNKQLTKNAIRAFVNFTRLRVPETNFIICKFYHILPDGSRYTWDVEKNKEPTARFDLRIPCSNRL